MVLLPSTRYQDQACCVVSSDEFVLAKYSTSLNIIASVTSPVHSTVHQSAWSYQSSFPNSGTFFETSVHSSPVFITHTDHCHSHALRCLPSVQLMRSWIVSTSKWKFLLKMTSMWVESKFSFAKFVAMLVTLTQFWLLFCWWKSALDGFSVTNSGSIMIPNGFTKPLMIQQRRHSTGFPSSPHQAFYSSSFTQSLYASMPPAAIPTTSVDEYNAYRLAVSPVTASPQYTTQDTYQRW